MTKLGALPYIFVYYVFTYYFFQQNTQLSAPIMSRFDLFFVLVDECKEVTDYAIARRIVELHSRQEESVEREYGLVCYFYIVDYSG